MVCMKLLAIIVNYKTADMTLQSLESLIRELAPLPSAKVLIVDNDSQDGSFEKISAGVAAKPEYKGIVEVQRSDKNGCLLYTSPSPRDGLLSRMPSSA